MKKLSLVLIAGSACIATSAFADNVLPNSNTAPKSSVYISGDIGYGNLSTPDKNVVDPDGLAELAITGGSHNTGSLAGGGNIGYQYAIKPSILVGAEFGYDYNGQAKYTEDTIVGSYTAKVISTDFHTLVTGTYLFNNGLNIFAKAGAARVDQKVKVSGPYVYGDDSITQYKPMVAGGIGYQFKMVNIFAQYSHIFGKNADDFSDLFNSDGNLSDVVTVDTFKLGAAVSIKI